MRIDKRLIGSAGLALLGQVVAIGLAFGAAAAAGAGPDADVEQRGFGLLVAAATYGAAQLVLLAACVVLARRGSIAGIALGWTIGLLAGIAVLCA